MHLKFKKQIITEHLIKEAGKHSYTHLKFNKRIVTEYLILITNHKVMKCS